MRQYAESVAAIAVVATLVLPPSAIADEADSDDAYDSAVAAGGGTPVLEAAARTVVRESGTASWYGPGFEGRRTASGEHFSARALTAAHKTLPFGTRVRVTAQDTLASVVVTINDRLPSASRHIIDLSRAAGRMLDMIAAGVARVRIEIID